MANQSVAKQPEQGESPVVTRKDLTGLLDRTFCFLSVAQLDQLSAIAVSMKNKNSSEASHAA